MNKDEGPADLLVDAIGEFRVELIEWIDSQLELLADREAWPIADSAGATAPGKVVAAPRPEPLTAAPSSTDARTSTQQSRSAEGAESSPPADSKNRLDAVARRLGERLRLAEESRKGPAQAPRDDVAADPRRTDR